MAFDISKITEYTIYCSECNGTETINTGDAYWKPDDTPSRYFKRQGWAELHENTICKDCLQIIKDREKNIIWFEPDKK